MNGHDSDPQPRYDITNENRSVMHGYTLADLHQSLTDMCMLSSKGRSVVLRTDWPV